MTPEPGASWEDAHAWHAQEGPKSLMQENSLKREQEKVVGEEAVPDVVE